MFETQETWPQDNEAAEHALRESLNALESMHTTQAHAEIGQLEREHAARRTWVWARLGYSPLAAALAHLHDLATYTVVPLTGTGAEQTDSYIGFGWRADAAALGALAGVEHPADVAAISTALRAIYQPWLDQSARAFQAAYTAIPGKARDPDFAPGTCLLFCDALRYDLAQRLASTLTQQGMSCETSASLAPFPGITPTVKPAVSPVAGRFTGAGAGELTPLLAERGTRVSAETLRAELRRAQF